MIKNAFWIPIIKNYDVAYWICNDIEVTEKTTKELVYTNSFVVLPELSRVWE